MFKDWPFGTMTKSGASREALAIAKLDLDKYGFEESISREFKRYLLLRFLWKRRITMQSEAVDNVWHAFIHDTKAYREFSIEVFGEYLEHTSGHFELDKDFPIGYELLYGEKLPKVWFMKPIRSFNCG